MKAIIIGGGIAGCVAALALRRAGIGAVVCEAYDGPAEGVGGVLSIAPNGLAALDVVGAGEAVRCAGQPIDTMVIGDSTGRRYGELPSLPGVQPMRLVWRADLYRVLQNLATEQGISVQYGKRIVSVVDGAGGITARFADGSTVSGDVLIGADGIHSTVRRLIDPNAPAPEYTGLLGFGGFADATGVSAEPREMYFVFGKRAFLGYWLAPDGRVMWFSNLPHEEALTMSQARAVPPGKWLRILRDVHRDETPGQRILEQATAGELHIVGKSEILATVPHWHLGRMVLTGDAAHAPSPSSGQGASLSIESAVELARCLRDLPDPQRAFRAYERLRRARVEKVAAQAASTNRNKAAGALGKLLMRVLMPLAFRTFMTPQSMFGWQYRYRIDWDAVVSDHA